MDDIEDEEDIDDVAEDPFSQPTKPEQTKKSVQQHI